MRLGAEQVLPMSDSNNYPPVPSERAIAEARGVSVAEVRQLAYQKETRETGGGRESRNRGMTEDERHAHDLAIARDLQAQFGSAVKPVSQRSAAAARGNSRPDSEEARFNEWLARSEHSRAFEDRAAAESTGSAGGALVPPRFSADLIRQLKDYDSLMSAFELWNSPHGETTVRPVYAAFGAAVSDPENTAFTDGPYPTLGEQNWGLAPTWASSFTASRQLVQDAFAGEANRTLDQWVSAALGESMGRVIAPAAQAALYAGITAVGAAGGAGGYLGLTAATAVTFANGATTELAANTINLDTAAQMLASLDEAYIATASWYFSRAQWVGLLRQVDAQKHTLIDPTTGTKMLYDIPVQLTSQTLPATASAVSGPVLMDAAAAMTLRIADGSLTLLRSSEMRAEFLEVYYRASLRADVQVRDARAMVGVKYAAS